MPFYSFTEAGRETVEGIITDIKLRGGKARIGETWMDYGGNIMWEAILCVSNGVYTKGMEYQLLHPVEFEDINKGELTEEAREEIIARAVN